MVKGRYCMFPDCTDRAVFDEWSHSLLPELLCQFHEEQQSFLDANNDFYDADAELEEETT